VAGRTALVLGNQLSHANPALEGADRVLLVESRTKLTGGRYHRQKLHLVLSAMRHFAAELEDRGVEVEQRRAESFVAGIAAHRSRHSPDEVVVLEPHSLQARERLGALDGVSIHPGTLFLTHPDEFADWAGGRRRVVMEDFYRWQRRRLDVLLDGGEPAGGVWNFDQHNRRPPPRDRRPPRPWTPEEDEIDEGVRRDLDELGLESFGRDRPRRWPATHGEALRSLEQFVERALPDFGPWQDAMLHGERWMWHSQLSSSLDLGLISPIESMRAAEDAYRSGHAPIASVEGYVRQVIGWREYVWGVYWLRASEWAGMNALEADVELPELFWGGETAMRCLADAVGGLEETAYAHHIERLMLFGNLILLLGVRPDRAFDWFHRAFIDGYEWVMAPNTLGMATYADGGRMMTKPYAATGRYVDRMSDHCKGCRYDPTGRTGEDACPFTTLYWDFMARHRERLEGNRRMRMPMRNLARMDAGELELIRARGRVLRERFDA
jgi:deoxyribodipyrimidine photolyase-related protein